MPKRQEFDVEFDPEADNLLADLDYYPSLDPENYVPNEEDIKLKNEVIELYNLRLDERIKRKTFLI